MSPFNKQQQAGFSLSELMIAMVLGLIIMLAVVNFFAPLKATVEESKRLEDAADALRYATLTLSKSVKRSSHIASLSANELVLVVVASPTQPSLSCLGTNKTSDYNETYRFSAPNLSCDDGDSAQILLTGLESTHFTLNGELLTVQLKPEKLPAQFGQGIKLDIALRKSVWQQALNRQQIQ